MKGMINIKDAIYILVLIGGIISSYYINQQKNKDEISLLKNKVIILETKVGNYNLQTITDKINEIDKRTRDFDSKFDDFVRTFYQFAGEYNAGRRNR